MMGEFDIRVKIVMFLGFLVALTMREAARAHVARLLGDNSAETKHRATINPIPHIDVWGTIIFPLIMIMSALPIPIVFGWAKPLEVNTSGIRRMRRAINLISLAGFGSNFLIAIACGIVLKLLGFDESLMRLDGSIIQARPEYGILVHVAISNLVIGLLNLLPFPGADGWRILVNSVNYNLAQKLNQASTFVGFAMLGLLLFGFLTPLVAGCLTLYAYAFGFSL